MSAEVIGPGRVAVVTGAASGIGRALAGAFGAAGCTVVLADIEAGPLEAVADELNAAGVTVAALPTDVADAAAVERLAATTVERFGRVDVLCNNAGVSTFNLLADQTLDDWRWVFDVNVWGVVHGCHVFAPRLRAQKRGHILNVGSAAGLLSPPHMAPYNASKAAVVALSETLYGDLAGDGVGVTVLCPTFIKTNLVRSMRTSDQTLPKAGQRLLERGTMTAEQVVTAALDGVERGALHVTPQIDGRWLWRLKRLAPRTFHALSPAIVDRVVAKLSR
jgi:short-subunit dehydrogenase